MTNDDRLLELRRQRDFLRGSEFRTSVQARRDILSVIVPLLNFNDVYYSNAIPVADVLGRPGFSSTFYDQAHAQIDSIVSQAINELECGLTPASPPAMPLGPTDNNETGAKWWIRYVVVPIIGGGGIIAIIVALIPVIVSQCKPTPARCQVINTPGILYRVYNNNPECPPSSWREIIKDAFEIGLVGVSIKDKRVDVDVKEGGSKAHHLVLFDRVPYDYDLSNSTCSISIAVQIIDDCSVRYEVEDKRK